MKQRFFNIALLALAVATAACTKSELDNIPTLPIAGEKISVTATIAGSDATRVSLTPSTDDNSNPYIKVDWKESGEAFAIINGEAKGVFTQTDGTTFEGTLPAGATTYYGVYPASAATDDGNSCFDIATQTGKLDESKTYMIAQHTDDGRAYSFMHATSLIRPTFTVEGNTLSNGMITKVVVKNTTISRYAIASDVDASTTTTGDITIERTPEAEDIYIYLNRAYDAGQNIGVWVYTNEGGTEKWYDGAITVPEGKRLLPGNLYTPTIALTEGVMPNTILYFASEKITLSEASGFGIENTDYTHTFADGIGRIRP